jgi:chromosome segregation ATPase
LEETIVTRRKLSDVLRQEVTKDAPEGSAPARETSAKASTAKSTTQKATASPAKEDQSAQLKELKAALTQGAEQEKALHAQIKTLQGDVKLKQKQIDSLELQLGQVSQLKADLAEAKEVILQLSEANTQMGKTLDELKQKPAQEKAPAKAPLSRTPLSIRPNTVPYHSMQHGPAPSKSKSVDVGWMD